MSRFKSYINPENIIVPRSSSPRRHITQISVINDDSDDDGDDDTGDTKPPVPPTRHPMVNRLTSSIDEALVNLTLLSQDTQREQERVLYELEQIFIQLRRYIEEYYRQYEYDVKSTYANYDQHIIELKSHLRQVREELIENFTSIENENEDYLFDIDKYRYLEMLTTQTLNQTMKDKKILPKYRIKLNHLEQLEQLFSIQCDSPFSTTRIQMNNIDKNDLSGDLTPIQRSLSTETSTSTNITEEYDNVPKEEYGRYRVAYHNALKTLERWSYPLHSGNYFIPLVTPYRQSSLLLYCLDRESFICYDPHSLLSLPMVIKWRGIRPSAVYWFDEMNMLFIACQTHIFGCYIDEDIEENQRIYIRIPVEQTSTWSDTQGELCWPKFLTCGGAIDRLLYAYWTDALDTTSSPSTSFSYYQIHGNQHKIKSCFTIDGRLRALHSTLSTYRLGLLIEQMSNQCIHLEIRTLKEFSLLAKFELRTLYEQFRYGSCLTNLLFNSNSYIFCDHKQNQLWHVNGDTGDIRVKHLKESIYTVISLLDGTLTILIGSPMRFDFLYDSNDTGIILKDLFHEKDESFEV